MTSAPATALRLIERLPTVRGRLTADAPLAGVTWFRVGGPAEVMFRPADQTDLADFLTAAPEDVPVTVMGVGSNLLIRDGGIPGVVVRLGREFTTVAVDGNTLTAGAAALDLNVSLAARNAGIAGLEFLSGIPGTLGGAIKMNGGAYGSEIANVFVSAEGVSRRGGVTTFDTEAMSFRYRRSAAPAGMIFTRCVLRGERGEPADIGRRMSEIAEKRAESQPIRSRTGGSTFTNPPGHKAWELIDKAGCRGLRIGDAQVSEKHCNFLLNLGGATAADLEDLGEEVRRRVFETTGVTLEWEIKRIGVREGYRT